MYELDGTETGEAHHGVLIAAGEIIWTGDGWKLRVVDLVQFEEEDASPFVGLLRVEPVGSGRVQRLRGEGRLPGSL